MGVAANDCGYCQPHANSSPYDLEFILNKIEKQGVKLAGKTIDDVAKIAQKEIVKITGGDVETTPTVTQVKDEIIRKANPNESNKKTITEKIQNWYDNATAVQLAFVGGALGAGVGQFAVSKQQPLLFAGIAGGVTYLYYKNKRV
jgi:hypothetical protein